MNPFDLPGYLFLPVFLLFGTAVIAVASAIRRSGEPDDGPVLNLSEPYPIAYLRGGASEVLRLATVSLVDRHHLKVKDDKIGISGGNEKKGWHPPVESAVLDFFATEHDPAKLFANTAAHEAANSFKDRLTSLELLPGVQMRSRRLTIFILAAAILWGTALLKIALALERGKHNIGFLILLTIGLTIVLLRFCNPKEAPRGKRLLRDLRTLLSGAKDKLSAKHFKLSADETILLAAVFGAASLPASRYPWIGKVFPKAAAGNTGAGSSCGSSCGSSGGSDSGGSSCGSSCGGGGGCGGCGS